PARNLCSREHSQCAGLQAPCLNAHTSSCTTSPDATSSPASRSASPIVTGINATLRPSRTVTNLAQPGCHGQRPPHTPGGYQFGAPGTPRRRRAKVLRLPAVTVVTLCDRSRDRSPSGVPQRPPPVLTDCDRWHKPTFRSLAATLRQPFGAGRKFMASAIVPV